MSLGVSSVIFIFRIQLRQEIDQFMQTFANGRTPTETSTPICCLTDYDPRPNRRSAWEKARLHKVCTTLLEPHPGARRCGSDVKKTPTIRSKPPTTHAKGTPWASRGPLQHKVMRKCCHSAPARRKKSSQDRSSLTLLFMFWQPVDLCPPLVPSTEENEDCVCSL